MKRILKMKLKLLLSNTVLATIFILYFSIFIRATTSFEANSETTTTSNSNRIINLDRTTTNISDIKPTESVKLISSSYPDSSNVEDEQVSKKNQRWHNSTERGWRTKRQNSPEEFAPIISHHQIEPHYERLMLLDSNPVDEIESESLTSQPTSTSTTSTKPTKGKRTLYACEEKQLQIECQLGESIQLIRANYGRFSIQICNEHGQLDWKVNCMSPSSFQIIANSCHAKQSCQLLASDSIFGNSCPGTQKYLEVHYQCVSGNQLANNRTTTTTGFDGAQSKPQHQVAPPPPPPSSLPAQNHSQRPNNVNVIPHLDTVNSERNTNSASTTAFGRHPIPSLPTAPQLPPWMVDVPIQAQPSMSAQPQPLPLPPLFANHSSSGRILFCPGKVLRQIRWPETEPGLVVQMPCPSHARSSNPLEPYAASLVCLQHGQWATRVQASRCQSIWLKNLTKQLETGDSLLAILSALIRETRPPATPLQVNWGGSDSGASNMGPATISNSATIETQTSSLFGDDLVQVSRIVRRLVEEMVELLNRINDDKQRLAFAREMVQSLVELVNNLAHEHQLDAWLDLAQISGERQRVSGQFVQAIEGASVLLAGASQQHSSNNNNQQQQQQHSTDQVNPGSEDLVKFSENVYVTIRSLPISIPNNSNNNNLQNRSLEVSFPSEASAFGFWWMNNQQRFTLHLQATAAQQQLVNSASLEQSSQVDVKYPQQQQQQLEQSAEQFGVQTLKIVFVMIKGLGSQMEPKTSTSDIITTTDNFVTNTHNKQRFIVNSNLVSLSIVADSRFKPVKVELSAPIELVFKHLFSSYNSATTTAENLANRTVKAVPPRCVYWDNNISDWLSDGCEWSSLVEESANLNFNNNQVTTSDVGLMNNNMDAQNHRNEPNQQQPRVQLDSVENKLILPNKVLYLAKMLDGHLFGDSNDNYYDEQQQIAANGFLTSSSTTTTTNNNEQQATNCRLLIYISCLISATLLALQLAAAAYNKAHARRLLGAIPANPPPSLLVTNLRVANSTPSELNLNHHQVPNHSIMTNQATATNYSSDQTSPTYSSSDYSVALQASKAKLEQQQLREQLAFNERQQHRPLSKLFHSATRSVSQHLKQVTFPIHLVVQLFILELLIVLLVESQNYLERGLRNSNLLFNSTLNWQTAQFFHPELVVATPPPPQQSDQFNPIGFVTWFLVVTLYYLIATITCWLAGQLIKLNVSLVIQHCYLKKLLTGSCSPSSVGSSTEASDKSIHYGATNSTAISSLAAANPVSVSICSQQQQQQQNSRLPVATNNFYGQNSCYGQYNGNAQHQLHHLNNLHSSTSPTSSFSSTGNQSMSDPNTALSRLEVDSTRLYGEIPRAGGISISGEKVTPFDGHRFVNLPLDKLYLFVIHVLPVFSVIVIALVSANKIESLNGLFYTTNFSFQIAYWPLLVELTSTPLSALLYYEPAICLILAAFALYMLRTAYNWPTTTTQNGPMFRYVAARKQAQAPTQAVVNPYGSSTINNTASTRHFQHISHSATTNNNNNNSNFSGSNNQMVLNKQSEGQNGQLEFGAKWSQMVDFRTNGDLKRAKFFCTMLLAILALHSICWISFFAQIHQALNSAPLVSSFAQHHQQQRGWLKFGSNHLTYVFTLSNLALTILISWWQRKTLRRAAQLSGITRFLCASSGTERSRQHTRFYRHQTSANGAGAKASNGSAQIKVSPSSQSLFIVSSQQQQQQSHQAQHPSYHYGPSYSSGSHQVSQHLYQQLSSQQQQQQHIYDSTSAINLVGNEQHHRFNMLLQQQQQQQPQRHLHQLHQQDAFTLNRSLQQQQRQFAQQQLEQRQLMTLKPTSMIQADNSQLLILDANQALKQQQQQNGLNCQSNKTTYLDRSGEAEGPLVAFTSSSASNSSSSNASTTNNNNNHHQMPATFGPNSATHHHQQHQFQQEQHNNFQMMSSEHQLFSHQQDQSAAAVASVASRTINCISGSGASNEQQQQPTRHSTLATRTSAADANQHQYCSINNPVGGNTSKNYTDALKAALLEQQHQHESSLALSQQPHFRPRLEAAANSISSIGQTTGISGAKHNNNNNNNHLLLHNHEQQLALLRHQADNSNIYDVANYALNQR